MHKDVEPFEGALGLCRVHPPQVRAMLQMEQRELKGKFPFKGGLCRPKTSHEHTIGCVRAMDRQ